MSPGQGIGDVEPAAVPHRLHLGLPQLLIDLVEPPVLVFLLAEGPDHPGAGQVVVEQGIERADRPGAAAVGVPIPGQEQVTHPEQGRQHKQRHQRQPPVHPEHQDPGKQEGEDIEEEIRHAVDKKLHDLPGVGR